MLLIMVHYLMLWTAATTYDDAPRQRARYHARAGAGPVQHHVEALLRRGAHAAARRVRCWVGTGASTSSIAAVLCMIVELARHARYCRASS